MRCIDEQRGGGDSCGILENCTLDLPSRVASLVDGSVFLGLLRGGGGGGGGCSGGGAQCGVHGGMNHFKSRLAIRPLPWRPNRSILRALVAGSAIFTVLIGATPASAHTPTSAHRNIATALGQLSASDPSVTGQFENFTIGGVTKDYYQPPSPAIGIHMVLLNTGDVLVIGAVNYKYPPYDATAYVWDPRPGAPNNGFVKEVDPPDEIYCSGVAFFSDGTVVATGGRLHNVKFAGPPFTYTFDPVSLSWKKQPNMAQGRFYPTETELPNGRVISTSGGNITGWFNDTIDVLSPGTPLVGVHTTPQTMDFSQAYPHQWVMPDGNTLAFEDKPGFVINTSSANPHAWTTSALPDSSFEHIGNGPGTVLLPGGASGPTKLLVMGGSSGASGNVASNAVEELDYNNLAAGWKTLPSIPGSGRNHVNTVLLPDGTVFVAGGNSQGQWNQPQHQELLFDPTTNTWTGLASNDPTIQRGYHSTAILLPDGRVLTGGDTGGEIVNGKAINDNGGRLEVYDPPYLFKGTRPVINSAPSAVEWNSTFDVASSPDVTRAVLVAPAATTHSVDMNQRSIVLPLTPTSNGVTLTAPTQDAAPPGYYMLFLLNAQGVPSVASWVHVGGVAPVVTGFGGAAKGPFTGGSTVVINGSHFSQAVGVKFGTVGASFTVNSPNQITAVVPPQTTVPANGRVDVTVEGATAQSATGPLDVFTYVGPFVKSVAPAYGPEVGGTSVTVNGAGFVSGDTVRFGGRPGTKVHVVSSSTMTVVAPAGTGLQNVTVTAPDGTTNPAVNGSTQFDYEPSVNNGGIPDGPLAISPTAGPASGGGSPVVVRGSNFSEATGVFFGTEPAESWKIVSDTEIHAVPPPEPSYEGYADVTVKAPGGSSIPNALDNYCWYNPALGQNAGHCNNNTANVGD
jgi:hypothetical protein